MNKNQSFVHPNSLFGITYPEEVIYGISFWSIVTVKWFELWHTWRPQSAGLRCIYEFTTCTWSAMRVYEESNSALFSVIQALHSVAWVSVSNQQRIIYVISLVIVCNVVILSGVLKLGITTRSIIVGACTCFHRG